MPHKLVESFKSTLDEARESDVIVHVVDVSHKSFQDQISVVEQTLKELKINDKIELVVFNKTDLFSFIKKDEDDLSPKKKENFSLNELKNTYFAKLAMPCVFISAKENDNVEEFKNILFDMVKKVHFERYPYNTI